MSNPKFPCNSCGHVVELVSGNRRDDEDYGKLLMEYRGAYPCFKCGSGNFISFPNLPEPKKVNEQLTLKQFYLAVQGFGSPCEKLTPKTILDILCEMTGAAVKHRVTEGPNPRLVIEHMELKNGMVLHFAPSQFGATVYKVTRA